MAAATVEHLAQFCHEVKIGATGIEWICIAAPGPPSDEPDAPHSHYFVRRYSREAT